VVIELEVENFHPVPNPVARVARAGVDSATRWAVERGVSLAAEAVPTAIKAARVAGGGKAGRDALTSAKKALAKLGGRDLLR
jgi:hypothetical protein